MSEIKDGNDHKHGRYLLNSHQYNNYDTEELANACRRLGISGPLEPLLRELKLKDHVSASQVKDSPRKSSHKKDKRQSSCKTKESPDCSETFDITLQQTAQKFGKSSYGQESWGRDSGARDLSPEPYRISESLGTDSQMTENETAGGTSAMLHLASKLQVAALSALKNEVLELSARLQNSERDRELMQKKLNEALEERERSQRRLEAVGSAQESKITEMHCVIVELSKKLKTKQESAIMEEHEPEGSVSELSFQEGSVYNSEMECTNFEQQSHTEPLDVKFVRRDEKSESQCSLPPAGQSNMVQIQAMHEEILYLRSHMALLQSKLASAQDKIKEEVPNDHLDILEEIHDNGSKGRSNYTSDDLCETAEIFGSHPADEPGDVNVDQEYVRHSVAKNTKISKISATPSKGVSNAAQLYDSLSSLNASHLQQKTLPSEMPISKMAERVRLRRTAENKHITGPDIMTTGICTTEIAEHLVSGFLPDIPVNQLQNEVQRLQRRIEHLRVQNTVLSITLSETKANCEHLYLLCGKYESNAVALNQALNCSDRTIEAYDVMLALLESKLGILENCDCAIESRKAAETVARHLMTRLESENNLQGNSLGPWQDAVAIYGSNNNNNTQDPWTDEDDEKLRTQMSKLKGQRATIQNTVVELESPYSPVFEKNNAMESKCNTKSIDNMHLDNRRMDLETAVLMQELMGMREDAIEYKCRAEQAEREKNTAVERMEVMHQGLFHLQAQLADTEALLATANKDRTSYSEAEHSAGIELELVEALARESRLKSRLQALAGSLETATKSSEERYAQVQSTVAELKQANLTLTHSLDRCKRKYQARLKRLEQQLIDISLRQEHSSPVKVVSETTL